MKRSVLGMVGFAVLLAVLVYWRCAGGGNSSPGAGSAAGVADPGAASTAGGGTASRKRVDPKQLARGSLAGTVTDDAGAPIPQARVCAGGSSSELPDEVMRDPICTSADDQGRYQLRNLLPARYTVNASAKPFRPGKHHPGGDRRKSVLPLAAGEHKTGIDISLRRGGVEITGTVSDLTGGPVAGAKVAAGGGWRRRSGTVHGETDAQGRFSLWVEPGEVSLTASADGYAENEEWGRAPGKLDILLTPESSLAGIVVDAATNQPVEGARVSVSESEWGWDDDRETAFTNEKGQFRVARLRPGRHVAAARTDRGYGRTEGSTLVGLGQHVEGVVIKLFPAVRVEGKIVISTTKAMCDEGGAWLRDPDKPNQALFARRAADGTMSVEGVLPGRYEVRVSCDGYRERDKYDPVVVAGKDVTGLVWEVDPGATIRGKVLAKAGDPIEGASIWARTVGGPPRAKDGWRSDTSAADGQYELTGLKPGSYQLELSTERGVPPQDGYKVDVAAGATVTQDLVLDDGGTIRGTVVDSEGKPVGGVEVQALGGGLMFWRGMDSPKSDDAGAFVIESVRPGDYRVVAQRSWTEQLRKPGTTDDVKQGERVTVRAGQTSNVKLVVEAQSGTIRGTVVDADGKPVNDAFVAAARESDAAGARASSVSSTRSWWGDERPVLTGVDGAFTVSKLSPGNYTLRAYRKGGGEAVAEHVPIGGTAKLQIRPTGSIEGTARRGTEVLEELTVNIDEPLTGLHRREQFYRTGGRFVVRDLPKGRFRITVQAAAGQKQVEVELAEGQARTGVDVELEGLLDLTGRVVEHGTSKPVPGLRMMAAPAKGGSTFVFSGPGGTDGEEVTDESGRFKIKNAPAGQIVLRGIPKDFLRSDYGFIQTVRTVDSKRTDVGDIAVVKNRTKRGDPVGELGVKFAQQPEDTPFYEREYKVSYIDPAGPAAKTDLKVGDVLTSIDGVDITGAGAANAGTLMRAPPGTKLALGLKRGAAVTVVLAPP